MIVVDTNILVYRLTPGPRNDEAHELARRDPQWAAPFLWRSELRNVLSGYLRRGTMDSAAAEIVINYAKACLIAGEHAVTDAAVFDLVNRSKCTSYDCEFVALALTLDSYLITEDQALLRSFPGHCLSLAEAISSRRS